MFDVCLWFWFTLIVIVQLFFLGRFFLNINFFSLDWLLCFKFWEYNENCLNQSIKSRNSKVLEIVFVDFWNQKNFKHESREPFLFAKKFVFPHQTLFFFSWANIFFFFTKKINFYQKVLKGERNPKKLKNRVYWVDFWAYEKFSGWERCWWNGVKGSRTQGFSVGIKNRRINESKQGTTQPQCSIFFFMESIFIVKLFEIQFIIKKEEVWSFWRSNSKSKRLSLSYCSLSIDWWNPRKKNERKKSDCCNKIMG